MRRMPWVLAFAVLLTMLLWWMHRTTMAVPEAPASPPATKAAAPAMLPASRPDVDRQAPSSPASSPAAIIQLGAPPPDAPWPLQIHYWKSAAQRGDPVARCEYARHARHCVWEIQRMAADIRAQYQRANTGNLDRGDVADCRGINDGDISAAFDHLLRAAAEGHHESQLFFAAGAMLSPMPDLSRIDQLRRYRESAGQFAWRAFAAGDSDAAVLLWRAYNRVGVSFLPLAGAIDPDPVKAHALDLLVADLVPKFVVGSAAEAGLNDEQAMQARALHAEWRSGAFAKAKPPRFGMQIETMFEWDQRAVDLCAPDER